MTFLIKLKPNTSVCKESENLRQAVLITIFCTAFRWVLPTLCVVWRGTEASCLSVQATLVPWVYLCLFQRVLMLQGGVPQQAHAAYPVCTLVIWWQIPVVWLRWDEPEAVESQGSRQTGCGEFLFCAVAKYQNHSWELWFSENLCAYKQDAFTNVEI